MANILYLEITETVVDPMTQLPRMIRIEVIDEADAMVKLVENETMFAGLKYTAKLHTHTHSVNPGENKPCGNKILKEVI